MSKNAMGNTRSFSVLLTSACSMSDAARVASLYWYLDDKMRELENGHPDLKTISLSILSEHPGAYRNKMGKLLGYPYKTWDGISNKSKYFRVLIDNERRQDKSQLERIEIARICDAHSWDCEHDLDGIMEDAHTAGWYPTVYTVRNACAARVIPVLKNVGGLILDWGVGDSQIIRQDGLSYEVQCLSEWVKIHPHKPVILRGAPAAYRKPRLRRDHDTGLFILDFPYDITPLSSPGENIMGVDLGKVKTFSGAVISHDGKYYTTELCESRELAQLRDKITSLTSEVKSIQCALNRIDARLLVTTDPGLEAHAALVVIDLNRKKTKLKRLRDKAAWIIARDVVNHARMNNTGVISVEDLRWAAGMSGSWDFSRVQARIDEVAFDYGITVETVRAAYTSQEDPFTGVSAHPDGDRVTQTSRGPLDRDYAAALVIAARGAVKKRVPPTPCKGLVTRKRPKPVVTGHRVRVPMRPSLPSRTLLHKIRVKSQAPGASRDVASTGQDERLAILTGTKQPPRRKYHQKHQNHSQYNDSGDVLTVSDIGVSRFYFMTDSCYHRIVS